MLSLKTSSGEQRNQDTESQDPIGVQGEALNLKISAGPPGGGFPSLKSAPGEESGHVQEVRGVFVDCDADTVLLKVKQIGGAACHEEYKSCFFRELTGGQVAVVGERVFDPKQVYGK